MLRPAGRRGVLRVLREPFWVRAALAVVLLSVACVLLGRWQWGRHEGKVADRASGSPATTTRPRSTWRPCCPIPTAHASRGGRVAAGAAWWGRTWPIAACWCATARWTGCTGTRSSCRCGRRTAGPCCWWTAAGSRRGPPARVPTPSRRHPPVPSASSRGCAPPSRPTTASPPPGQELRIDVPRITGPIVSGLGAPAVTRAYGVLATEDPRPPDAPSLLAAARRRPRAPPGLRGPVVGGGGGALRPARRLRR